MSLGFSDQSLFTRHFQRLLGVTPGQFRTPARIAYQVASPAKKESNPLAIVRERGPSARSNSRRGPLDRAAPLCCSNELVFARPR